MVEFVIHRRVGVACSRWLAQLVICLPRVNLNGAVGGVDIYGCD